MGPLPFTLAEIQARLQALTLYGSDIFVADANGNIPLWTKHSGLKPTGLDYLVEISKEYYVRRQRDITLKKGDRVAVLGRGIAAVEHVDETEVEALLGNKTILRMRRNDIAWNRQNMRWEAKDLAP